jgi:ribonuclease HII
MSADLSIEKQYSNYVIAGVDEVGRGAWAGPVVVSAVIINQNSDLSGIADSKSISAIKRQILSSIIKNTHSYAIGSAEPSEIDQLNINGAIRLSIERAIVKLPVKPDIILLDGNYSFDLSVKKVNVIKGDAKSISIAAASIVAKQYRDELMTVLGKDFPDFMWDKNVGYGTLSHRKALAVYGITKHHRLSYKPIKEVIISTKL